MIPPLRRLSDQPTLYLLPTIIVVCIALMAFVDQPLALYCKSHLSPHWEGFFKVLTTLGEGWGWYAAGSGAFLWGWWRHRPATRAAALWLLTTLLGSGLLVHGLKAILGRSRPRLLFEQNVYGFDAFDGLHWATQSFPSGHSQTIWAAMTVLMVLRPNCRLAFIVVGCLVSVSRVATTVHFLSDVVMGGFLGMAFALMLRDFFLRRGK
ncbi:MAG: Phosphoesterase PA-phosphatase related [Rhodospirillaceae bacterium]|nr:MAG: Phosphoesterase PA-phosphatase related [Rhodospirillaceae bacterium]